MYLIVSAFRKGATHFENLENTAALLLLVGELVTGGTHKDAQLVVGVYGGSREVSVRIDMPGVTRVDARREAALFALHLKQETVAIVDSGSIELVDSRGIVVAQGDLEVSPQPFMIPGEVTEWTTTTGDDPLIVYSPNLTWNAVPA